MINVLILSQPHRFRLLQQIIDSLNNQTLLPDTITLVQQGYSERLERDENVKYIRLEKNIGAIARFIYPVKNAINITLDDDMIPGNRYVEHMVAGLNDNSGIVSMHGYYWSGGKSQYQCHQVWEKRPYDMRCIMLGTGVAAWDESKLNLRKIRFENFNRLDVQVALFAAKAFIPMWCLNNPGDIVTHVGDDDIQQGAIWKQAQNCEFQQKKVQELLNIFTS